jgi:hypothetical protein
MIATTPRSKASSSSSLPISTPEANAPTDPAGPLPDLLAGLRLGAKEWVAAVAVLLIVDVFAGWSYLVSYFAFFRIPSEALGLTLPEVLGQGLRTVLLPLTVILVAAVAPGRRLRQAAVAVGVYLVVLLAVALVNRWGSTGAILVQLAAAIAAAGIVFGMRLGIGARTTDRLLIGAAALLLLLSIPIASGTLDAGQTAGAKSTTLVLVTTSPVLPSGSYVLLRENDSQYWVFRIGDHYAYSIPKSEVVYIRY